VNQNRLWQVALQQDECGAHLARRPWMPKRVQSFTDPGIQKAVQSVDQTADFVVAQQRFIVCLTEFVNRFSRNY
jgi:hypothetical protein